MMVPDHVERTAIVLDDVRLVYVPIPKAGSTAVLWALLDLAGLEAGDFAGSTKLETTRALTIHDVSVWGRAHHLGQRGSRDQREVLVADDWFLFTVVREPVRRLWSAWVSKLLVHDPRFVAAYGDEPWFPDRPRTAADVADSFRAFVEVLAERPDDWHDPHWSSQVVTAGTRVLPYDLVAHLERLPSALEPVNEHLRRHGRDAVELRRENSSLLPFESRALDTDTWARCTAFTMRDREAFGYDPPEQRTGTELPTEWVATVEARLPAILAVTDRNERIGDLKRLLSSRRAS